MTASIPILMYHQIGDAPPAGTPLRGLVVHPSRFRSQMQWMRRMGYRGLSMRDLMPYLAGQRHGRVFGITFDDGYCNVFRNALPILASLDFTATTYVVSGQVGGVNAWDLPKGIPRAALMNASEIQAWHAAGQEIGAHTIDHVHLPELDEAEANRQIAQPRQVLEQIVGAPVRAFCYPYGEHRPEHRRMASRAGYISATSTLRGRARLCDDMFCLPRVPISGSTNMLQFLHKCLTGHEDRKARFCSAPLPDSA